MSFNKCLASVLRKPSTTCPASLIYRMSSCNASIANQKLAEAQEEYKKIASKLAKKIGTHAPEEATERLEIDLAMARQKVKKFQLLVDNESPLSKVEKRGSSSARDFLVASLSGEISPEMVKNVHDKIPDAKLTPTYGNLKDIAEGLSQEVRGKKN